MVSLNCMLVFRLIVWENSVEPGQTAPETAVWLGYSLFAPLYFTSGRAGVHGGEQAGLF